jgi:hypothetical protein
MQFYRTGTKNLARAAGVGVATAVILSLIMVPALRLGVSPFPKAPSLAFAQVLFGDGVPLLVGLLFHVAYVTFWSVVYVSVFRQLTFRNALYLGLALWAVMLVFFFPFVGWGFFGLGISARLIVSSFVPHVLFAAILWGLSRWAFRK